jgi:hypothetical protein
MTIVSSVRCRIGHHEPNRRKVKWNGLTYVSQCVHCGKQLERHGHKDWREVGQSEPAWRAKDQLHRLAQKTEDTAAQYGGKIKGLVKGRNNPDRQRRSPIRRNSEQ